MDKGCEYCGKTTKSKYCSRLCSKNSERFNKLIISKPVISSYTAADLPLEPYTHDYSYLKNPPSRRSVEKNISIDWDKRSEESQANILKAYN